MKQLLLNHLICPRCLPAEHCLTLEEECTVGEDIDTGTLICTRHGCRFPIVDGVAMLTPQPLDNHSMDDPYETDAAVSAYLWGQYGDLLGEEQASTAYADWAALIQPQRGIALDAGAAVGRFTFELSTRCDLAVGIDTSLAFIRVARRLMQEGTITFWLKEEGLLHREVTITLPEHWRRQQVEFIVADALALPFPRNSSAIFSSLNLVDKVPSPLRHLQEMNRVTRRQNAQFLLSDPFSWSTTITPPAKWLGGTPTGRFAGKGVANIARLLTDSQGELTPVWQVTEPRSLWWTLRTHSNHYELIRSWYIRAHR
ncbi:MAG: methyltransferase domain-containing protein [Desulfobulbus sp.]|nr:methyltransferase domain-containing protein [Desulfobulbus sp.]